MIYWKKITISPAIGEGYLPLCREDASPDKGRVPPLNQIDVDFLFMV